MPKRPRQAHIPRQQQRRRKSGVRRQEAPVMPEGVMDLSSPLAIPGFTSGGPVAPMVVPGEPVPGPRRAARASAGREQRSGAVRAAGQLPTFDRAYLSEELRRIGMVSGSLLALLVVLTVLLR